MTGVARRAIRIWRLTDGKPGHDNQTRGLSDALAECTPVEVFDVAVGASALASAWSVARGRLDGTLPRADLVLGAGHRTHLGLLTAARCNTAPAIVLMKPSLPLRLFDLCIIPEHDEIAPAANVILTRGAINRIRPGSDACEHIGLVLIGGPSAHYTWPQARVIEQVRCVIEENEASRWTVAVSRRTPLATLQVLKRTLPARTPVLASEDVGPDWLARELPRAGRVWVTQDSVSMVYESLTAGAATGLIELTSATETRITRAMRALENEGAVLGFSAWRAGHRLAPPKTPLHEAARCAREVLQRFSPDRINLRPPG